MIYKGLKLSLNISCQSCGQSNVIMHRVIHLNHFMDAQQGDGSDGPDFSN